eukprot:TRINITY_DN83586_c0_g1_i1.p1 TRINITY_DN83586_c0_g1~~TRINITY_DN83586_c0_g1_i1.p1  ORF type:complete len:210 (+),score=22.94 TRINITY_DN83586_c0_g1_i1:63-692(+)
MAGERYRFLHRKPRRSITDDDRKAYREAVPKLIECCRHWQHANGACNRETLRSLALHLARRAGSTRNVPAARLQIINAHDQSKGAAVVLHGSMQAESAIARIPPPVLAMILDMAYFRQDSEVATRNYKEESMQLSKISLLARCPRPYNQGPILLPKSLDDFPTEFGWQDWSNTTWTDPLRGMADEMMDVLLGKLPGVFRDEDIHGGCDY